MGSINDNLDFKGKPEVRYNDDKEFFRCRDKLTVKLPKFTQFKIQPYITEEPFNDFDANELNKNRVYAIINFEVVKNFKADIYYIFDSRKKIGDWTDVNF